MTTTSTTQSAIDAINNASPSVSSTLESEVEAFLRGEHTTRENRSSPVCDPNDIPVGIYNAPLEVGAPNSKGTGQQVQAGEGYVFYSENIVGTGSGNTTFKGITIPSGYRFKILATMLDAGGAAATFTDIIACPSGSLSGIDFATVAAALGGYGIPLIPVGAGGTNTGLVFNFATTTLPGGFTLTGIAIGLPSGKTAILTIFGILTKDDNTRRERADTW